MVPIFFYRAENMAYSEDNVSLQIGVIMKINKAAVASILIAYGTIFTYGSYCFHQGRVRQHELDLETELLAERELIKAFNKTTLNDSDQ